MSVRSLAFTAFFAAATNALVARADLHCQTPTQWVGVVRGGKPVVHTFTLTNRGPEPIEIVEIKPTCGCLRPQLDLPSLRVNESAKVTLEINTVTQAEGSNRWGATVRYTAGGQMREMPLVVAAMLQPDVRIEPANMVIYTDAGASHGFTLVEHRATPLPIQKAMSQSPHVTAVVSEPKKLGETWVRQVRLEVKPMCPEGRHEDVLQLITGDPEHPELKVPFTVIKRTRGKVTASPMALQMWSSGKEGLPARLVFLGTMDEEKVKVDRVETSHESIRCTFAEGPGSRSTLRVLVDRDRVGKDGLTGQVRVHLSQPTAQVVTIPVSVR